MTKYFEALGNFQTRTDTKWGPIPFKIFIKMVKDDSALRKWRNYGKKKHNAIKKILSYYRELT